MQKKLTYKHVKQLLDLFNTSSTDAAIIEEYKRTVAAKNIEQLTIHLLANHPVFHSQKNLIIAAMEFGICFLPTQMH